MSRDTIAHAIAIVLLGLAVLGGKLVNQHKFEVLETRIAHLERQLGGEER